MSIIPDCRTDDAYNEKYLNEGCRREVIGYDWCTEEVVDNFFDNIKDIFDDDTYIGHFLNEELPESMQEEYEMQYTFGDKAPEVRKVKTYADLIRSRILDWIECERDELIISMIEGMDDEEYQAIKAKVDAGE